MVPTILRTRGGAARILALLALWTAGPITGTAHAHDGSPCPPADTVGEYVTGEVREYETGDIREYVTGEIPEYVTGEIPEYQPRADGSYISGTFPPAIVGSAYVEVSPGVFVLAHGEGGRAFARHARLIGRFRGDRLVTYETYGFPPYRHRENDQDVVTEHWTYPEEGTTFIFCGDRLIRAQYF